MGKGGKTNRVEPTDTSWMSSFLDCAVMFQRVGWFDFFERIKGLTQKCHIVLLKVLIKT